VFENRLTAGLAEEPSLELRMKYWTSKRRCKRWWCRWWRWWTAMCDRWKCRWLRPVKA